MSFGQEFLARPDLFPARPAGEPWGGEEASLSLPGGPYRLAGLATAQAAELAARFDRFCSLGGAPPRFPAPPAEGEVGVRFFRAAADDFHRLDHRGWELRFDVDDRPRGLRVAGEGLMALADGEPPRGLAVWTCDGGGAGFAGAVENLLRLVAARRLAYEGSLLVHSVAIVSPGTGVWLGVGRSGIGKSTLAHRAIASGLAVLSDDLNVLRLEPRPMVESVPFTGDLEPASVTPGRWPLAGLFRLAQGSLEARPLSPGETLSALLASVPFLAGRPLRALAVADRLAASAATLPAFHLAVPLDEEPWRIMAQCAP